MEVGRKRVCETESRRRKQRGEGGRDRALRWRNECENGEEDEKEKQQCKREKERTGGPKHECRAN